MTKLRGLMMAASVAALCVPAAAFANISGNYLVTLKDAHPASYDGQQFCAQVNDNGSILGWPESGTVTVNGQSGQFFVHHGNLASWFVDNSGIQQYSGHIAGHGNGLALTSFVFTDSSGNAYASGGLSNQRKGSC